MKLYVFYCFIVDHDDDDDDDDDDGDILIQSQWGKKSESEDRIDDL